MAAALCQGRRAATDSLLTAVEALRSRLDRFRMEADADLAALLRELRGAIAATSS